MRITRALAIRNELKQRIADLYAFARFHGPTHAEMLESLSTMRGDYPKTPAWVWSYLDGYKQALTEDLYRNHLIFGGFMDGKFYSTHCSREDYYGNHGIDAADYADNGRVKNRGHYWDDKVILSNGGTYSRGVKPYFINT